MKLVIKINDKVRINKIFDWLAHMVCYALILVCISLFVGEPHFTLNREYFGLWALVCSIVIYILNKTVKPIIFYLTLPITGLTLGLFYPFINVLVLYITSFLMLDKFHVEGVFTIFLIALFISIINILLEDVLFKSILKGSDKK